MRGLIEEWQRRPSAGCPCATNEQAYCDPLPVVHHIFWQPLPLAIDVGSFLLGLPVAALAIHLRKGENDPRAVLRRGFDRLPPFTGIFIWRCHGFTSLRRPCPFRWAT